MREIIARLICGATLGMVLVLSFLFASLHNPPVDGANARVPFTTTSGADPAMAAGRAVYLARGCASCHAIAGQGNPRSALDDVGTRRSPAELREYVTGTGAAAEALSRAVVRRKAAYREMRETEMAALVAYLSSLSAPR